MSKLKYLVEAIKPLKLQKFARHQTMNGEASSLIFKLTASKFICSVIMRPNVLSKINVVSKMLQASNLNFI